MVSDSVTTVAPSVTVATGTVTVDISVTIVTTISLLAGGDDATYHVGAFSSSQTYQFIGTTTNSSTGTWSGFRFKIPTSVTPANITDVHLNLYTFDGTGSTATAAIRVEQGAAAQLTSSGARRPDTLWGTIGSTNQVSWTHVAAAANANNPSPDLSASVLSALALIDQSTEYIGIMIGPTGSSTGRYRTWSQDDGTPARRPTLTITEDVLVADASVTTTAPSAGFGVDTPTTFNKIEDVSYHDSVGSSTRRVLDIFMPHGTAPAGGWPVVMYLHGGAFISGSENDITLGGRTRLIRDILSKGFALVAVRTKLTNFLLDVNTGWTRPHIVRDLLCATTWISTQGTYDLDASFIVGLGYSAGGHAIMEAALLAEDATPDSYPLVYRGISPGGTPGTTGPLGDRYTDYPALDHTEGRTGIPTFKGVFTLGGPWDLPQVFSDNPTIEPTLNLYYGGRPSSTFVGSNVDREGDLGAFITSETGTIYDGRTASAPSFPIGISYSTGDTTVPTTSSYTPMRADLNTVGYDVSQDTNMAVATGVALSRYGYAGSGGSGGHDNLMITYDSTFFTGWLDEVIALQSSGADDSVTTTAPVVVAAVGTTAVTISAAVTTTAPSVVASVGSAAVTISAAVTTAAPTAVADVGTAAVTTSCAVTTTAPTVTATAPAVTVTLGDSTTTTAPGAVLAAPTAAVSTSTAPTTTAPSVTLTVPTVTVAVSAAVTSTAPSVVVAVGTAAVATAQAVTTTAPVAIAAVGSSTAVASLGVTTTAPQVFSAVGAATVDVAGNASVTTTAPSVDLAAGTAAVAISATVTTTSPSAATTVPSVSPTGTATVTITAAAVATATPTPLVVAGTGDGYVASAVSASVAVPTPTVSISVNASTTTAAPVVQTGVGSASVSISVDVAATAPALAIAAGSAAVSVDAIFTALAAAILVASDGLSVDTIDAVGALFYAWNGTAHVAVDLRYTDGAGLDAPVTLELAE